MSRRAAVLAGAASLLLTPMALLAPATADPEPPLPLPTNDVELTDLLAQLPGLIEGLAENRTDMARCPDLAGGGAGLPEALPQPGRDGEDQGNPLAAGDESTAPTSLPDQVLFRSEQQTFNRRYQFALVDGHVWYRSNTAVTGIHEPWAQLDLPDCFAGRVAGISVDDDEMIAVDQDRWVYVMDGALSDPAYFTWTMRWGRPFWTGAGRTLPSGVQDWEWSVVSQREDGTWRDAAGNDHQVGDGKVSHIWMLSHHGQRLTYIDPWLPPDESYEMCGPHRGRFGSAAMSASGSTVFVVGRYGDLFTRLYDFDISGADPLFFDYSYADQRGADNPVIQLPSPAWVEQPKVPGVVTDRISIHKVGTGSLHRQLRVEGRRDGRVGYWHKDIAAPHWRFTATGGHLEGAPLANPRRDTSARGLGPGEDRHYTGTADGARITVPGFNVYCTPAPIRVRLASGERFTLRLHTVDNIRQSSRARGLDDEPRMVRGTIEVPAGVRRSDDPEVRAFLAGLGEGRFVEAPLDATTGALSFRHQGWVLEHRP